MLHTLQGSPAVYWDAATMFVAFILGGRAVLTEVRLRAAQSLALHGLLPPDAYLLDDSLDGPLEGNGAGRERVVAAASLQPGQHLRLPVGCQVPADVQITAGSGDVEAAILTGEARPMAVSNGDAVQAGARVLATNGDLTARVTAVGADTALGRLLHRSDAAAGTSARTGRAAQLTDRLQVAYGPVVLVLAIAIFWWWRHDPVLAWNQAIAVVLACCPCALGLAAPLAYARFHHQLARHGVVVRDPAVSEVVPQATRVVVDKTGTLTSGAMTVVDWHWLPAVDQLRHGDRTTVAQLVAAAEASSRHPQAPAVIAAAEAECGLRVWRR